jgi:HlyD family secretion protein
MRARVELGQGVATVPALVRLVEPAAFTKVSALGVEEQRVNVILDFAGPLDKVWTLGDAFRVEAHIVTHREEDALKVPVGALFREGEGWAVFLAQDGRAAKRALKVTRRNGVEAMVEDGLEPGARVIVYPSDALRDGSRIEIPAGRR